jgi:hypothetical protein
MIRKVLWLGIPVGLGVAIAAGWPDIIRFARIKQISLGSGHPEAVPADGRRSYPESRGLHSADGTGDFDSARRGGPALLTAQCS